MEGDYSHKNLQRRIHGGRVSSAAMRKYVGHLVGDTGTGPVGVIPSSQIDAAQFQKAGRGFSNSERDSGPSDAGSIDAKANRRDYGQKLGGSDPFTTATWSPRWFNKGPMSWDDPPEPRGGVTGQSALDRARRGES